MLSQFLIKQLNKAKYKILPDGAYFASIPWLRGVWASAGTLEDCRTELQSVNEKWQIFLFLLVCKIYANDQITARGTEARSGVSIGGGGSPPFDEKRPLHWDFRLVSSAPEDRERQAGTD